MLKPGSIFNDNFLIIQCLGSGGFGQVYHAFNLQNRQNCSLKILGRFILDHNSLINELHELKKIDDPRILKTYGFSAKLGDAGADAVICEYVDGIDLDSLANRELLGAERALTILIEIAKGIDAIHKHGIIHRDLKLDNVLILPGDQIKIIDFGLAISPGNETIFQDWKRTDGCLYYRAPEQKDSQATFKSDLYAFGIMLYRLLTGGFPIYNFTVPLSHATPYAYIDEKFDAFFKKLTATDPSDRPDSMQVVKMLESLKLNYSTERQDKNGKFERHNYLRLGYFDDFDSMIFALAERLRYIDDDTSWFRLDGQPERSITEKFQNGNDEAYIAFRLDSVIYKINGDTTIAALKNLVTICKQHIHFGIIDPHDFLIPQTCDDGKIALRLKDSEKLVSGLLRANGFYCYEVDEDALPFGRETNV